MRGNHTDRDLSHSGAMSTAVTERVLGRRTVAALIDIFLLGLDAAALGDTTTGDDGFSVELEGAAFGLWAVISLGYYVGAELTTGTTIGKRVLGLVVRSDAGEPASSGQVVIRNLLRIVDALPILYLVGFVTAAITQRNQRVGDLAARTVVVRAG